MKIINSSLNITTDGPTLSLVVTNLFSVSSKLTVLIFAYSEVAKNISAAQRIKEYEDNRIFEDELKKPLSSKIPDKWPSNGEIKLENISIRYRKNLPLVIKNLSFFVNSKEKVGIVGRTGSGKSTLLLALMRILEITENENNVNNDMNNSPSEHSENNSNENSSEKEKGKIFVDGIDISTLGLHDLRKNLTIIPQDPNILEGTIRFNIDPENNYKDEEVINILKKVKIWDSISADLIKSQKLQNYSKIQYGETGHLLKTYGLKTKKLTTDKEDKIYKERILKEEIKDKDKLEFKIDQQSLSLGQLQLICIARALIKKPKILLMDEATASIDQKTDSIIQKIIKNELKETTVITIAHRLLTVIQYDKIIVMKNGLKADEGAPAELLKKRPGAFWELLEEVGEEERERLSYLAENRKVDFYFDYGDDGGVC